MKKSDLVENIIICIILIFLSTSIPYNIATSVGSLGNIFKFIAPIISFIGLVLLIIFCFIALIHNILIFIKNKGMRKWNY